MMRVAKHLFRGYGIVYAWFWGIVALVMAVLIASLKVLGVWLNPVEEASVWQMIGSQAPMWFGFTIGIMLAAVSLPVMVAHGVTRREYAAGAGVFALGSAVLFGLVHLAMYAVEYGAFRVTGILDRLELAYPWPTPGSLGRTVLAQVAFMLAGWLVGLCFYRFKAWYAILLTPIAGLPIAIGFELPVGAQASRNVGLLLLGLGVLAGYLIVRAVPIRPKKA